MSERSCPVSGSAAGRCPAGMSSANGSSRNRMGPRGCSFSGFTQPGDVRAAFNIPNGVATEDWLRMRERKAINEVLYSDIPTTKELNKTKNIDTLTANEHDLLAVALGAPARQVLLRAEQVGPQTGWRDGWLSAEYGFVPPDPDESVNALANSPGRVWSDLCERMPGIVSRGRAREAMAAMPVVEGTEDVIPDAALWAALVGLGLLCSLYRYEDKHDGHEGVSVASRPKPEVDASDDILEEVRGLPRSIGLPYVQISKRMGRPIPHLTFVDQSSYNVRIRDPKSDYPYVGRFENMDLRWPIFGDAAEIAFLKGCADTSASFQHGPDAMASCQEHVMNGNVEGLLREMIRLKEILERMPNAFHSISVNPKSGDNFVSADEWVRWAKFSAPLSKRCPASSGLQFPPYLLMDAFLGRKDYGSFLGAEGLHLRAWQPSNLRAFIAAFEYHYSVPDFVARSGDPRLMGVLDGIVEAYTGERGFMGVHRYKVFGILEVAAKTGRTETNGNTGQSGVKMRPWEETHKQFSDAMKERLEPYRGKIPVEPHQMRGTFEECRYRTKVLSRSMVDNDPKRSLAMVTLDIQDTGITFQPGDRLAIMPLNSWEECAKVALALGLEGMLEGPVAPDAKWGRFVEHLGYVSRTPSPTLTVRDVLRRGHLAPLTQDLVLKVHDMLRAQSNTLLRVLATDEWPVRGSLGDLLQAAVVDTPGHVWDSAFDLGGDLGWLASLVAVEVPRTYSISNYPDELLPSTVDLSISRAEYDVCATFGGEGPQVRSGVSSGFLNPAVGSSEDVMPHEEEVLVGVSRPQAFQLPLDGAAPCAFFAGGSGVAPFRSFWQARVARRCVGRNILYLGVQSRDKFCYEDELRAHVNAGHLEVHTAFSRDARGLVYDGRARDLVERPTPPRYIDALITEQGETVCDMVMSKRQGGLGGYLYVCGSVSVFDAVMRGIRRAIFDHRTATMASTDTIVDTAFAERRFMLDVFMTPKPLPCNLPTISQSRLALHTGHRPDSRMWIGVHGKVYDITDFAPMHPGGVLIIKSNAGVDCSTSFDNLAHTNNPEVNSLLTKYFVGHLTPKPDYHGVDGLGAAYDMWADYLRTVTETLVAQQFEMNRFMGAEMGSSIDTTSSSSSQWWYQADLVSIKGIRSFYQYQSRLLQGHFAAMFGPKFQELVLKLSFNLANSNGPATPLPDVLGVVARAKSSADAARVSRQVARVGDFVREDNRGARFHERGIMAYAAKSVELDMALLEDIRQEACGGMDALESIAELDVDAAEDAVAAVGTLLLRILERMARRLGVFYENLARVELDRPEIEANPARTRWHILRRRVRDGSFFVLAREVAMGGAPAYVPRGGTVDFDRVFSQVRQGLPDSSSSSDSSSNSRRPLGVGSLGSGRGGERDGKPDLNALHTARTQAPRHGASAYESHANATALRSMSAFVDKNMRAIRRLSRLPPQASVSQAQAPISFDELARLAGITGGGQAAGERSEAETGQEDNNMITPPGSSSGSVFGSSGFGLNRRGAGMNGAHHSRNPSSHPQLEGRPPTPPQDGAVALGAMITKLNVRPRPGQASASTSSASDRSSSFSSHHASNYNSSSGNSYNTRAATPMPRMTMPTPMVAGNLGNSLGNHPGYTSRNASRNRPGSLDHHQQERARWATHMRQRSSTSTGGGGALRSFKLGQGQRAQEVKMAPTF